MPSSDAALVLDCIQGFRRSKTLFAAVELGVFDALAEGPQSLVQLARRLSCSEDGLERLLDACVGIGFLRRQGRDYANADVAAKYLTSTSPDRMTGYLKYSNDAGWKLWGDLEGAVREGSHRWTSVYGWEGPIFSHFFRDDHAKREFLMGMHGFGLISSPAVVAAVDLSPYKTFVDLGGATGHLAIAACERYGHLRGVVFDLPEAAPLAQEMTGASPVADRLKVVAGDFFVDPLPPGDLYALGRIVHDWSVPKIVALLTRIFDALPSGGALLIVEKVLADDKSGPAWAQMQNLNMLTCTEGKERTFAEYDELLRNAGFADTRLHRTDSPADGVLAIKA
jgi:acetylserotonin N-methyltransferase